MAATTIFFNGVLTSRPGSYSQVDASGLEQVGLGASGIVAVLGTGEGGIPVSEITELGEIIRITKPEAARQTFRSGDLREVADMLFAPSNDPAILGGAQEVVAMKVNPATASAATLPNAQGDALDLTSKDYGAFTEQVNIEVADGTSQGKLVTIRFEDQVESVDDLGGDNIFQLQYDPDTDGWTTMTAAVEAGGDITCAGTRDTLGLDSDIGTTLAAQGAIEVVSTDAGDTNVVTVYGLDATGAPVSEQLTLTGTTAVVGTQVFGAGDVLGVKIAGTHAGTVSVDPSGGGADIFTVTTGTDTQAGMVRGSTMYAASLATLVSSGASTKDVILVGKSATGATQLEKVTLTGTTPVAGVAVWSEITGIVLGDVEAAQTITTSATAAKAQNSVQNTIQKAADYFNARQITVSGPATRGFICTVVTGTTTFDTSNLDVSVSAVNCLEPANPGFLADLYTIAAWITSNSQYLDAAVSTGATGGAPTNTTSPQFLAGGGEGTTAFANWQAALNLLKQVRVNTIVVLTGDPAVHAALDAHCAYMGGVGRSERDGVVGLLNTALDGPATKTEVKSQIVDLNSRHIRAVAQSIERFNTAGERTTFDPPFTAAVIAGMQAGSPVGTSLTFKYANILGYAQDSTWNPTDDAEELIQAGLCFFENVEGVGRRVTRNVTTHLSSSNIAFTEASVNEAVNFATFNFRTNMEDSVGRPGFAGTVNAAKGIAINTLGLLVDAGTLVQWRSLDLELIVDVLEVGVEIAPVIPINFVKNIIHLVTIQQSA